MGSAPPLRGPIRLFLLLALGAGACRAEARRIALGPPVAGAKSLLVNVLGSEDVYGLSLESDQALEIKIPDGQESGTLEAVAFDQTLTELRLLATDGPEPKLTQDEPGAMPLPAPSDTLGVYQATFEGGTSPSGWTATPSYGPQLTRYGLPARPNALCATLSADRLKLPIGGDGSFAFILTASIAAMGTKEVGIYLFDKSTAETRPVSGPHIPVGPGARDLKGGLWLVDQDQGLRHQVVRAEFDIATATIGTQLFGALHSAQQVWQIVATEDASGAPVLYASGERGDVDRLDATGAETIHQFLRTGAAPDIGVHSSRAPNGDVLFTANAVPNGLRIKNGVATSESIPVVGDVDSVAWVDGFGFIVATGRGELWADGSGSWASLPSPTSVGIVALAPLPGGFMVVNAFGHLFQYAGGQYCPEFSAFGYEAIWALPFGADLLSFGRAPVNMNAPFTIIHLK